MGQKKEQTHDRIISAANRLFRERGSVGAGVDVVMKEAGLTHGGFYAHFASKQALLAESLAFSIRQVRERLLVGLDDLRGVEWLQQVVRRYLSRTHRDDVEHGCLMPAIISELSRADTLPRQTFEHHLRLLVAELEAKMPERHNLTAQERALATAALFVGGLSLSRAVEDRELSDQILRACRRLAIPELEQSNNAPSAEQAHA
jgi:TetR/AcrR family transcriptional repressor of nem operon